MLCTSVIQIMRARKLSRTGHTSWTLTEIDFTDGPYLESNSTATTLTPSGTTGSVTITASASTFAATDVGRLVSFSNGRAKITNFSSATSVTATTQDDFDNTNAVTNWKLGAFSGYDWTSFLRFIFRATLGLCWYYS